MEIYNTWTVRPSVPAAASGTASLMCSSAFAGQAYAFGTPPAGAVVRISPEFVAGGASGATSKTNSIGKAASLLAAALVPVTGDHQVQIQLDMVEGVKVTGARGIPPRGWPV